MKKEAKKRLYESTLELLKESDYENLTIGKICHNADLSRQLLQKDITSQKTYKIIDPLKNERVLLFVIYKCLNNCL